MRNLLVANDLQQISNLMEDRKIGYETESQTFDHFIITSRIVETKLARSQ